MKYVDKIIAKIKRSFIEEKCRAEKWCKCVCIFVTPSTTRCALGVAHTDPALYPMRTGKFMWNTLTFFIHFSSQNRIDPVSQSVMMNVNVLDEISSGLARIRQLSRLFMKR